MKQILIDKPPFICDDCKTIIPLRKEYYYVVGFWYDIKLQYFGWIAYNNEHNCLETRNGIVDYEFINKNYILFCCRKCYNHIGDTNYNYIICSEELQMLTDKYGDEIAISLAKKLVE